MFRGQTGLYDLASKAMESTGGTFREDVEDVLANDQHAVVLARHYFTRNGRPYDYRTAHVYDVRDAKLASCWEQPRDPDAFGDAWRAASQIAASAESLTRRRRDAFTKRNWFTVLP